MEGNVATLKTRELEDYFERIVRTREGDLVVAKATNTCLKPMHSTTEILRPGL